MQRAGMLQRMLLGLQTNIARRPAKVHKTSDAIIRAGQIRCGEVELEAAAPISKAAQNILKEKTHLPRGFSQSASQRFCVRCPGLRFN